MKEKMIRIGVILANQAEELDSIVPVQLWRKAGYIVELISLEKKNSVIMNSGIKVSCDGIIDKINLSQFNALYIPGGNVYKKILDHKSDQKVIKSIEKDFVPNPKKYIITSNEGINTLTLNGLIDKKEFTGIVENKNEFNKLFKEDKKIVTSGNLISSKGPLVSFELALEVIKIFSGNNLYKKISGTFKE